MTDAAPPDHDVYDVVVIGAGPAGATAALHLARARKRVLVIDANRPRHSATLVSHGYLTRDGIAPNELRAIARDELASYPSVELQYGRVTRVAAVGSRDADAPEAGPGDEDASSADRARDAALTDPLDWPESTYWRVVSEPVRGSRPRDVIAEAVVVAVGCVEELPELPSMRTWYGTALHSCVTCDGYEKAGQPLALIVARGGAAVGGDDLRWALSVVDSALELADFSHDIRILTLGAELFTKQDRANLEAAGVRVDQREAVDLEGTSEGLTGLRMADGELVEFSTGFVLPVYRIELGFIEPLAGITLESDGRQVFEGLFLAGDAHVGPGQLITAAADGAECAREVRAYLR